MKRSLQNYHHSLLLIRSNFSKFSLSNTTTIHKRTFASSSLEPQQTETQPTPLNEQKEKTHDKLFDTFGRRHNYLRISLTERCNLRCQYCMPEEGVMLQTNEKIMTKEEIVRLSKVFVECGVDKIRFTGGEPLVRKDVEEIVEEVGELKNIGLKTIAMTTNGILLSRKLPRLYSGGLSHLNISLDTLVKERFERITRRLGFEKVISSIDTALNSELYNFSPLKINCVVMRGINDDEIVDFVNLTKTENLEVRFIEYMPFDGNGWKEKKMVTYTEMLTTIKQKYPNTIQCQEGPNDTSKIYQIPGFVGKFAFITSMSDAFCGTCNRIRLTADGNLKVCLFGNSEVSLRDAIRNGASDLQLKEIISSALFKKKFAHAENLLPLLLCRVVSHVYYKFTTNLRRVNKFLWEPNTSLKFISRYTRTHTLYQTARYYSTTSSRKGDDDDNDENKKPELSHIDSTKNLPKMVNVSEKPVTYRTALARSIVEFPEGILDKLLQNKNNNSGNNNNTNINNNNNFNNNNNNEILSKKGPVFATAIISGTMAAKNTSHLIPFCHSLNIEDCKINITISPPNSIIIECEVSLFGKTGVEMEALVGASVASLTIYDMCKALSHNIVIKETKLIKKTGGKSDKFY